ncbi:MAG: DUF1559 domain-containing protein, partial [Planctomycetota bacterium]
PAVQAAREAARRNQCSTNVAQLARALQMHHDAMGEYPGYINAFGGFGGGYGNKTRAPWVVYTFPHLEQSALYDQWREPVYNAFSYVETLVCPSNPPSSKGRGNLAYVANCGHWMDLTADGEVGEVAADGMFFNRSRRADHANPETLGAADKFDGENAHADAPEIVMSMAYIQARGDGTTGTLMLSESLRTVRYGYAGEPSPQPDEYSDQSDEKYHFGFTWVQPKHTIGIDQLSHRDFFRINGQDSASVYNGVSEMTELDGFPSSNHNSGVNAAFAAGQVRFLREDIDPVVYCQLMTTSHKESTLRDPQFINRDAKMRQPTDEQY